MKFQISLGKGKTAISLDPLKLIDRCALIQGARDSGKSYLGRVIVEQTIPAGLQTIILDPEGEYITLREKCDVVIAGKNGDVPVEVRSAKLLARRIAETGVSVVVDLSALKPDERKEFVKLFLDTFDQLPKKLERPRLGLLDESHIYAPEAGKGTSASKEAVILQLSQGRKRGMGWILLTQRLSKLSKDAAAECGTVFIGATSPVDLVRAADELGIPNKDKDQLRHLKRGEFYVTGSALLGADDMVVRFHTQKALTTHPEPGSRYKLEAAPPRQVIQKILKDFSELPPSKEVEEAENLKTATARIRELERQLRTAPAPQPSQSSIEAAVRTAVQAERKLWAKQIQSIRSIASSVDKISDRIFSKLSAAKDLMDAAGSMTDEISNALSGIDTVVAQPTNGKDTSVRAAPSRTNEPRSGAVISNVTVSGLGRMLATLARYPDGLSRQQLAIMAMLSPKSGTFANYLSSGKQKGLWNIEGGIVKITTSGVKAAGDVEPLPVGEELVEYWCAHKAVTGAAADMLRTISRAGDSGLSRDDLADSVGLSKSSGTFANYLSRLRTLGLISRKEPFIAAEELRA